MSAAIPMTEADVTVRVRGGGELRLIDRRAELNRDVWIFGKDADAFTDAQLLGACGYVPMLGGHVERTANGARVNVYND